MAWKTGYANGYKELLVALKGFLSNAKKAYNIQAGGGNVGDGYVSAERASTSPVDETWTLTATSATNFTVTGSVSGSQAAATVGTAYDNGIVAFTIIAGSTAFQSGDSFTFDVADGLGATEKYTVKAWNTNYDGSNGYELLLMAPGTGGSDEIYMGINTVESVGDDYYNWRVAGMTGYATGQLMSNQPGRTQGRLPRLLMWTQKTKYWFSANGRRVIVVAKIGTVYQAGYLGFALPYGLPSQFPYPMVAGGAACPDTTASKNRYSSLDDSHRAFPHPYALYPGDCTSLVFDENTDFSSLKVLQGTSWNRIYGQKGSVIGGTNIVWPYSSSYYQYTDSAPYHQFSTMLRQNIDGSYPLFPTVICISSPSKHIFGELQGVFAVPGFGGITAEDTLTQGGYTYVVFPIIPNADRGNYWALKLE